MSEETRINKIPDDTGIKESLNSLEGVSRPGRRPVIKNLVMSPVEWLLILALSILWGGSFFFSKVAVAEVPPFTLVLSRVFIAAIALNIIVLFSRHRMPGQCSLWRAFFAMGAINNLIPFSLIFWGQTQIASGLASVLNATTPLFSAVLAHFLTGEERLTRERLGGVLLGLTGVAMMIGMDALGGLGLHLIAELAIIAAAVSYALAGIFGRRFRGLPPLVTATGQISATTLMVLPVALIADRPWNIPWPGGFTVSAVVCLGLLCTALAYIVYFRILASAGATNVLLVTFLIPVSALLLGANILGESLDRHHFYGMFMIALGLAAIDGRPLGLLKARWGPYKKYAKSQ